MAIGKQPFFRAPSVPKMGKKTVSSSVFSNVSEQIEKKFKISPFRFLQPKQQDLTAQIKLLEPKQQDLSSQIELLKNKVEQSTKNDGIVNSIIEILKTKVEQSTKNDGIINSTLVLTNRVLEGVRNQFFSYFVSVESEKKQELAASKASAQKRKIGAKEKSIEEPNKINQVIGRAFSKVTAPAKSIFDKILEFFSVLLTGILVNSAWMWLQDPKNREKVGKFFSFIAEHWRWIVRVLVLGKLLGFLYKVYRVVNGLRKGVDLLRKGWDLLNKTKKTSGPGGGGGGDPCNRLLQCMGNPAYSAKFVAASIAAFIANQQLTNHIKDVAKGLLVPSPPTPTPTVPPVVPPTTQRPTLQQQYRQAMPVTQYGGYSAPNVRAQQSKFAQNYPDVNWGAIADWGIAGAAVVSPFDAGMAGDAIAIANLLKNGRITLSALRSIIGEQATKKVIRFAIERGVKLDPAVTRSKGGTIPKESPKKKCNTCSLLPTFSSGGTVGGPGSGNVDSVLAMLAPGEEVIRSSAANLFRPLLKDINDNAGRMWQAFQSAINIQEKNNFNQLSTSERFSRLLDSFNKELKSLIQKEKLNEISKTPGLFGPGKTSNVPKEEGTGGGGPSDIPPGDSRLNEIIEPVKPDQTSLPTQSPQAPTRTPPSDSSSSPTQVPTRTLLPDSSSSSPSTKPTPIPTRPYKPGDMIPESATKPPPKVKPISPIQNDLISPIQQPSPTITPSQLPNQSFFDIRNQFIAPKPKEIAFKNLKKPSKKTTSSIVPFQMPPIDLSNRGQQITLPEPSTGSATDVPPIASFDASNSYVYSTPLDYGMLFG